jgi:hypothetical protein
MVELYFHFPTKPHGVVFNSLSTGITLPYIKEHTLSNLIIRTLHEAQITTMFSIKELGGLIVQETDT